MRTIHEEIAKRIKDTLKKQGKSADLLAREIDLSRGYFYELLSGKKNASVATLKRIADGLEVPIRDLLPED